MKKRLNAVLEIPQAVEIIKKWGLSSRTEIRNMPKTTRRHDTSVDIFNDILIREDRRKKIYKNYEYKILENGA